MKTLLLSLSLILTLAFAKAQNYPYLNASSGNANEFVVNASGVIINMKTGTETACNGTLYDDGGASANYGHSKTYTLVIQPTGATSISMNFSQ